MISVSSESILITASKIHIDGKIITNVSVKKEKK